MISHGRWSMMLCKFTLLSIIYEKILQYLHLGENSKIGTNLAPILPYPGPAPGQKLPYHVELHTD